MKHLQLVQQQDKDQQQRRYYRRHSLASTYNNNADVTKNHTIHQNTSLSCGLLCIKS